MQHSPFSQPCPSSPANTTTPANSSLVSQASPLIAYFFFPPKPGHPTSQTSPAKLLSLRTHAKLHPKTPSLPSANYFQPSDVSGELELPFPPRQTPPSNTGEYPISPPPLPLFTSTSPTNTSSPAGSPLGRLSLPSFPATSSSLPAKILMNRSSQPRPRLLSPAAPLFTCTRRFALFPQRNLP